MTDDQKSRLIELAAQAVALYLELRDAAEQPKSTHADWQNVLLLKDVATWLTEATERG